MSLPGTVLRLGKACTCKSPTFEFDVALRAGFQFAERIDQVGVPCVPPAKQLKFRAEFKKQFSKVRAELNKYKWLSPDATLPPRVTSGPCRPRTDLQISVSEDFKLTRSLVPAWSGQRGRFEFPAHRVVDDQAGIAHESVHVLFPNANRMLAEGLAVYLQQKLFPKKQVYPNFGVPLIELVAHFLSTTPPYSGNPPHALWSMDLDALEQIATPEEVSLGMGRFPPIGAKPGNQPPPTDEVRFVYAVTGLFVGFLLDNPAKDKLLNANNFSALYRSTPLRPLERDPGKPKRWRECYKRKDGRGRVISYSFKDLSLLWKTYTHFKLFTGGKDEMPIPDSYRRQKLVTEFYNKLEGIAG
jgi:hypothetical protein